MQEAVSLRPLSLLPFDSHHTSVIGEAEGKADPTHNYTTYSTTVRPRYATAMPCHATPPTCLYCSPPEVNENEMHTKYVLPTTFANFVSVRMLPPQVGEKMGHAAVPPCSALRIREPVDGRRPTRLFHRPLPLFFAHLLTVRHNKRGKSAFHLFLQHPLNIVTSHSLHVVDPGETARRATSASSRSCPVT